MRLFIVLKFEEIEIGIFQSAEQTVSLCFSVGLYWDNIEKGKIKKADDRF